MTHCNKKHSLKFENYCVDLHANKYNHKTYHWNNISEDILYDSGFITDFNTLRLNRKRDNKLNKINSIQEYGLDGIAIETIDNVKAIKNKPIIPFHFEDAESEKFNQFFGNVSS